MNFKNIASELVTKLMIGIVLSSAIIIAVVFFLQVYHNYLLQFTNGPQIEMATYAVILIGSAIGIYFLLFNPVDKPAKVEKMTSGHLDLSLESLGFQFLEGFMNGLSKRRSSTPTY